MKILLIGNPNVGKSVIFSRLTGAHVTISNYPGTTVEFTKGHMKYKDQDVEVIDVPGTYSLEPTCEAEQVAVRMIPQGDLIVNVVDSTNLERNLYLTLQLLELGKPVIVTLNIWDEARQKGIYINYEELEKKLGVPVVPSVALSGYGLSDLVSRFNEALKGRPQRPSKTAAERWAELGQLVGAVQKVTHRHRTWLEALQDASLRPVTGFPIAILVLFLVFQAVIFIGEGLIEYVLEPFFETFYLPLIERLSIYLGGGGFIHDIFIGKLIDGGINFEESLGVLTTGLFVEFGIVLPYLIVFYLVLGFLEDFGYLPRLGVLIDRAMHYLGLHGYSIIPLVLGLGCNVPAALAIRNLESRRERFIACTLMAISVPCMAQLAIIFGLVGRHGGGYLAVVFASLFAVMVILGLLIDQLVQGYTPSMIMEIPSYRLPHFNSQLKKLWMRVGHFLRHATPYILGGILVINILFVLGIIEAFASVAAPVVSGLFGLPREAISTLLIGFLRKDVAVAMLEPLQLTAAQMVVGSVVLAVYFPCAATVAVLIKELGARDMAKSALIMILTAVSTGTILNFLLKLIQDPWWVAVILVVVPLLLVYASRGRVERAEEKANDVGDVSIDMTDMTEKL